MLALAAYGNALANGFVWDDTQQILQNSNLRPGSSWWHLFTSNVWAFAHNFGPTTSNDFRPLQMAGYRLIGSWSGFSPAAFHWASLVFHIAATLLVYAVVLQLIRVVAPRRQAWAWAAATAALFAVHPVHTEAVDWASALPDLGCTVFYLLAFLLFLLAIAPNYYPRRSYLLWIASCVSFFLALLWKEMALTLPLVIGFYSLLLGEAKAPWARLRRAVGHSIPSLGVLAAYVPWRFRALGYFSMPVREWVLSPIQYALTDLDLVGKYWWKLAVPLRLNAYYLFDPVRSLAEPRVWAAIAFLVLATIGIVWGWRRQPLMVFAAGWVFLCLIPVLNLRALGRNVFAERYLYLPSAGFCLLVVWLANAGLARVPSAWRRRAGAGLLSATALVCMVQAQRRNPVWHDQLAFFTRTVAQAPNSPDMENGLAAVLRFDQHDFSEAVLHYQRAAALAAAARPPERDQIAIADQGLALIAGESGDLQRALSLLDQAQAADPGSADVISARGGVLLEAGRWQQAEGIFHTALQVNPNDANAWNGLGYIAWHVRHADAEAAQDFQQALASHPLSSELTASLHEGLGAVECEMGRCPQGIAEFQSALAFSPNNPEILTNLALAYKTSGYLVQARATLQQVLALDPTFAPAREALAGLE
ncbi:MAG TPA: tetratricopeptide repeat protein [Terriglobales bacterium]|nr:tetratricopeptide repeat protein [Terriglobales bacterium]